MGVISAGESHEAGPHFGLAAIGSTPGMPANPRTATAQGQKAAR